MTSLGNLTLFLTADTSQLLKELRDVSQQAQSTARNLTRSAAAAQLRGLRLEELRQVARQLGSTTASAQQIDTASYAELVEWIVKAQTASDQLAAHLKRVGEQAEFTSGFTQALRELQAELFKTQAASSALELEAKLREATAAAASFGGNLAEGRYQQSQADLLREALRFRQEMEAIDQMGLGKAVTAQLHAIAQAANRINLDRLEQEFAAAEREAKGTAAKISRALSAIGDKSGISSLASGLASALTEGVQEGIGETAYEAVQQAIFAPFELAFSQLQAFVSDSTQSALAFDRLEAAMQATSGSTAAAYNLQLIRDTALELGRPILASAEAFHQLNGAAQETILQGDGIRSVFRDLQAFAAGFQVKDEVFQTLTDQFSANLKAGFLETEDFETLSNDLSQGLGSAIPNAAQLGAEALNVTTEQFNELLAAGKVVAEDFIPKFAQRLAELVPAGANQAGIAIGKLQAQYEAIQLDFGDAVSPLLTSSADLLGEAIADLSSGAFTDLKQEALAFQAELASNKALADGLRDAFSQAATELTGTLISAVQDLSRYLSENPDAIARMVEQMSDFVNLVLKAAQGVLWIADRLAQTGAELDILTGKTTGGNDLSAEAQGMRSAYINRGLSAEQVDAILDPELERLSSQPFAYLRGNAFKRAFENTHAQLEAAVQAALQTPPEPEPRPQPSLPAPRAAAPNDAAVAPRLPAPRPPDRGEIDRQQREAAERQRRQAIEAALQRIEQAQAVAQRSQQQRITDVRRQLLTGELGQGEAAQAELQRRISAIEQEGTQQRIANLRTELAEKQRLYQQGAITAEELAQEEARITLEQAQTVDQQVQQEIEAQAALRQARIDALADIAALQQASADNAVDAANAEVAAQQLVAEAISSTIDLMQAKAALADAVSESTLIAVRAELEQANSALDLFQRLQSERDRRREAQQRYDAAVDRGETPAPVYRDRIYEQELAGQLRSFGIDPTSASELALLDAVHQRQDELAQAEHDRQNQQLQFQAAIQEQELNRAAILADIAVQEAQINQLKAEQALLAAETAYSTALIQGDPTQIQLASQGIEIAQRGIRLASDQVSAQERARDAQQQAAEAARALADYQWENAQASQAAADAAREQQQATERSEAAANQRRAAYDQLNPSGDKAPNPPSSSRSSSSGGILGGGFRVLDSSAIAAKEAAHRAVQNALSQPGDARLNLLQAAAGPLQLSSNTEFLSRLDQLGLGSLGSLAARMRSGEIDALSARATASRASLSGRDPIQAIEQLATDVRQLASAASRPQQVNVISPDPARDTGQILHDLNRNGIRSRGL